MKLSLLLPACLAIALVPSKASAASFTLTADLTPYEGVQSSGSGFGEIDVSDDLQSIFVTLVVSGLSGNVAAGTGVYDGDFGTLVVPLNVPIPSFTSGILTETDSLPQGALQQLLAGNLYLGVFTVQSGGITGQAPFFGVALNQQSLSAPEIGGQLQLAPEPATVGMLGIGLAALGFAARRRAKSI
jgi:hypothetical protein